MMKMVYFRQLLSDDDEDDDDDDGLTAPENSLVSETMA